MNLPLSYTEERYPQLSSEVVTYAVTQAQIRHHGHVADRNKKVHSGMTTGIAGQIVARRPL